MPLHLRLTGRRVLVVGAGPVGRRRVAAALGGGAQVRWVAPDVPPSPVVAEAVAAPFAPAHLRDVLLAFACAPPSVNATVVEAARAAGVLVGRADAPEEGDLVVPAVVRRGPVTVGLTSGAPTATVALRRALEAAVPDAWGLFAALVAEARERLAGGAERTRRLRALADGPLLALLVRGDVEAARRLAERA